MAYEDVNNESTN